MTSTITAKGQTTIPKAIRERFGITAGGKIKFFEHPDGSVFILPVLPARALRGVMRYEGKTISIEEMDKGIAKAVTAREQRSKQTHDRH